MFIMYDDVSFNDFSALENTSNVSVRDSYLLDPWLNPLSVSGNDISSPTEAIVEVDLSTVESYLEHIEKYCNLAFGFMFLCVCYYFVRKIVYRINTKGKGID